MADLTRNQADLPTVIVGATSSGTPTTPIGSDTNGNMTVVDTIQAAGQQKALTVSTTAVQAIGGASVLANRKFVSVQPTTGNVYWGMTSAVTVATGMLLVPNQQGTFSFSSNCPLYLIASAPVTVIVAEG